MLALLLTIELVPIALTAAIVEWLTPLLKVVKVPFGNPVLTGSRSPGQEAHLSGSSALFAAVVTLGLGDEAVHVAFTSSIVKLLTLLSLLVVSPSCEVASTKMRMIIKISECKNHNHSTVIDV